MSNVAAAAFCPFISAAGPKLFGFDELDRAVQAARPGEDLRHGRVRQVEVVPRVGGLAVRHAGHAARAGPAALRRDHQADRGVRLRGSRARRDGQAEAGAARRVLLDERGLRHGHEADRRLRQVRLVHGHPRRRGRRQGRGAAGPHLHERRRRPGPEVPDRDRHHRPPRGRAVASSASCRCATTRTPTTPCSSAAQTDAEAEEVRPAGGDGQRGDLGPAAVHHGDVAVRPLPEGDGPRQDRLVHGGDGLRGLAEPLDQELRQREPERRARR